MIQLEAENDMTNFVECGKWESASWEFWNSNRSPSLELCTAIGLVPVTNLTANEVILTKNQRGWEMIAGKIEPGESPKETCAREGLKKAVLKSTLRM